MQVIIHLIFPAIIENGAADLTADEKLRAAKFHFAKDRAHWIACRAGLRRVLGEICGISAVDVPLKIAASGKPFLDPPFGHIHFNLSHCHDLAIIAVCPLSVGVDVEPLGRAADLMECVAAFCHPDEIAALPIINPAGELLKIWTAKEAVLKALGTGLMQAPDEVIIEFKADSATARCDRFLKNLSSQRIERLRHPALAGYCAFVAVAASISEIVFYNEPA